MRKNEIRNGRSERQDIKIGLTEYPETERAVYLLPLSRIGMGGKKSRIHFARGTQIVQFLQNTRKVQQSNN